MSKHENKSCFLEKWQIGFRCILTTQYKDRQKIDKKIFRNRWTERKLVEYPHICSRTIWMKLNINKRSVLRVIQKNPYKWHTIASGTSSWEFCEESANCTWTVRQNGYSGFGVEYLVTLSCVHFFSTINSKDDIIYLIEGLSEKHSSYYKTQMVVLGERGRMGEEVSQNR